MLQPLSTLKLKIIVSLLTVDGKPVINKAESLLSLDWSSHCIMSIYPILNMQSSCAHYDINFILPKIESSELYYCIGNNHESGA